MWLTRFSISRPIITALVFIALAIFGIISFTKIGRSNDPPGVTWPIVVVYAGYPGASPQEIERLIVKPIEDQLDGIDNLDELTATSQEGSANIGVQFKLGTDLNIAAIDVQAAVDRARGYLPSDLDPPSVEKNGASQPLMDLAISSKSLAPTALADIVNNRVVPLVKSIPNVQTVDVYGSTDREFHVEPIPARMEGANATLREIYAAVAANNANLPGGIMRSPTQETTVSVHAEINTPQDILNIPLPVPGMAGKNLRIGDVANAYDSHVEATSISHYNGLPRLYMQIGRNINADEIKSTETLREGLKKIESQFPDISFHEIDAPADYTQKSLNGVWQSLIEGVVLTMITMLLFLHLWRNAVVVMIAIPSSILATFVMMNALGFHFDSMSLMGLSLIIGILVDDSIVVLENITRHRDLGEDPIDAAINGRSEIGGAAIAITAVDVVVFLPIAFMSGIVGAYLKEFGMVIVVATLFSLLVSFTLTPLLAARWSVLKRSTGIPQWMEWLGTRRATVIMIGAAIVAYFIPFGLVGLPKELSAVIPIMIVATLVLNLFVQNYERVLNWYKTKAVSFGLDHGTFVVWFCVVLLLNSITLVMGAGMTTAILDGIFLLLAVIAHAGGAFVNWFVRKCIPEQWLALGWTPLARRTPRWVWLLVRYADLQINAVRVCMRAVKPIGRHRWVSVATLATPIVCAIVLVALGPVTTDFVPAFQDGEISMTVTYPAGTPLLVTEKYVSQLEQAIMKLDGIQSVSSTVGRKPEGWGSAIGDNYARLNAQTLPERRKDTYKLIEQIRNLGYLVPGGRFEVAGESGGGSGTPIFYAVSGPDDQIGPAAEKIAQFLRNTPGSVNVITSNEQGAPRLNVDIDARRAEVLGVAPADAAAVARFAVDGAVATKVRTENGLVDVRLQFPLEYRQTPEDLKQVRVRAQDGTLVPLQDVATFTMTTAPVQMKRLNRQTVVNVYGGVLPSYSLGAVTGPLEQKLNEPGFLPEGVHLNAQGDSQMMQETFSNMMIALVTSFMLIFMLLVVLYGGAHEPLKWISIPMGVGGALLGALVGSATGMLFPAMIVGALMGALTGLSLQAVIVMMSVPVALIGALLGISIMHRIEPNSGQSLNIISMIGIVMLFGLVAKNGILLVDYSNTLCKRGMRVREAVVQAAATRFRPILMTTCAMIFGMLPLSLGFAEGGEWRQAVGTVIIGGLLSSLILTLFLVPMTYNTWIGFLERRADKRALAAEMTHPVHATTNA